MSDSLEGFERPREATIQFSDTFGRLPIGGQQNVVVDFDSELTAKVRNTGKFNDKEYPIGLWPSIGEYGAVLVDQLALERRDKAQKTGAAEVIDGNYAHPDHEALGKSVTSNLVVIVNSAPRRADHHDSHQNGDEFYVGATDTGVEVYGQLPYFRGLKARGRLESFHRIPNDGGVWDEGEQFRSSLVSWARTESGVIVPASQNLIPDIELPGRIAYTDTFGNVRLEVADIDEATEKLRSKGRLALKIGETGITIPVKAYEDLTAIEEGQLGIYHNPTEREEGHEGLRAGYLELARRDSDPNHTDRHAYVTLASALGVNPNLVDPRLWDNTPIELLD